MHMYALLDVMSPPHVVVSETPSMILVYVTDASKVSPFPPCAHRQSQLMLSLDVPPTEQSCVLQLCELAPPLSLAPGAELDALAGSMPQLFAPSTATLGFALQLSLEAQPAAAWLLGLAQQPSALDLGAPRLEGRLPPGGAGRVAVGRRWGTRYRRDRDGGAGSAHRRG